MVDDRLGLLCTLVGSLVCVCEREIRADTVTKGGGREGEMKYDGGNTTHITNGCRRRRTTIPTKEGRFFGAYIYLYT